MAKNTYDLSSEQRRKLQEEIIYFFQEERDEELGIDASFHHASSMPSMRWMMRRDG